MAGGHSWQMILFRSHERYSAVVNINHDYWHLDAILFHKLVPRRIYSSFALLAAVRHPRVPKGHYCLGCFGCEQIVELLPIQYNLVPRKQCSLPEIILLPESLAEFITAFAFKVLRPPM